METQIVFLDSEQLRLVIMSTSYNVTFTGRTVRRNKRLNNMYVSLDYGTCKEDINQRKRQVIKTINQSAHDTSIKCMYFYQEKCFSLTISYRKWTCPPHFFCRWKLGRTLNILTILVSNFYIVLHLLAKTKQQSAPKVLKM